MIRVPIVLGVIAVTFLSVFFAVAQMATPQVWSDDDDRHWSRFHVTRCATLIEEIPIVARAQGLPALTAALSSVVGYYERIFPILGPPVPQRVPKLVNQSVAALGWPPNPPTRDSLAQLWYDVETRSSERFFDTSRRTNVSSTEGTVRSYGLLAMDIGTVGALERLAKERVQAAKIDRLAATNDALKSGLQKKTPIVLVLDRGKLAYTAVGLHEQWTVVIDPDSAKPLAMPADQVLLGEQDRKSTGEFATRARNAVAGEMVFVDEVTVCQEKRPIGIRFLDLRKITGQVDAYAVQWGADFGAVQRRLKK